MKAPYEALIDQLLNTGPAKLSSEESSFKSRLRNEALKYAYGSVLDNPMQTPQEALYEGKLNAAKAKAAGASNPAANLLSLLGNASMQYGAIQSKGTDSTADDVISTLAPVLGNILAMGTPRQGTPAGPAEVEGGETFVTPGGETGIFKGPSHENGGVDVVLPEGTRIFSKRLKEGGVSHADLVAQKQRKIDRLKKRLQNNPTDGSLKTTLTLEEEQFESLKDRLEMKQGEAIAGKKGSYAYGTPTLDALARSLNTVFNVEDAILPGNDGSGVPRSSESAVAPASTTAPEVPKYQEGTTSLGELNTKAGDVLGVLGTVLAGAAPLIQARNARADDTINPNFSASVGDASLDTIDEAKVANQIITANQKEDLRLSTNAARRRAGNTSRSLNTSRAVNLAITQGENKALRSIESEAASRLTNILTRQSDIEFRSDVAKARGAQQADIANRQDEAANESAVAQGLQSLFESLQRVGKMTNESEKQKMLFNLSKELSKYNLAVDNDGNIINNGG